MKFMEASSQLQHALKEQKTINTRKLREILNSMNVSFKANAQHQRDTQVEYLKGEIKKLNQELAAYQVKVSNQRKEIKRLRNMSIS